MNGIDGMYKKSEQFEIFNGENVRTATLVSGKVREVGNLMMKDSVFPIRETVTAATELDDNTVLIFHGSKAYNTQDKSDKEFGFLHAVPNLNVTAVKGAAFIPRRKVERFNLFSDTATLQIEFEGGTEKFRHEEQKLSALKDFAYVWSDSKNDYFVVIWGSPSRGQYWAEQSIPISGGSRAFTFDMNKYDYRPVSHWLGCDQDLCIESEIDAALFYPSKMKIFLYRERFLFSLNSFSKTSEIEKKGSTIEWADAAFMLNGKEYVVTEGKVSRQINGKTSVKDIFPQLDSADHVDAILQKNSEFHVFTGKHVTIYHFDPNGSFKFVRRALINDTWPTVWPKVDAAFHHPLENSTYFFKGDFHIVIDGSMKAEKMKLNQGNLWQCRDVQYSDYMADLFDVHGYSDFVKKIEPIRRKKLQESIAFFEDEKMIHASGTKKPEPKSSKAVIVVVVIMILILVIGITVATVVWCMKRKNSASNQQPKNAPEKSKTTTPPPSTSTSNVSPAK